MLHHTFTTIVSGCSDEASANRLLLELTNRYSEPHRHYHTMAHLEQMVGELAAVRHLIGDWPTTFLAVCYHDSVYGDGNNEDQSAKLAEARLGEIGFPEEKIKSCGAMIRATKTHLATDDDTNFLLDADLSILGKSPKVYREYSLKIRKEFARYPDALYNPGRKAILQNFLDRDEIFKTKHFLVKYEEQARLNVANEIMELG